MTALLDDAAERRAKDIIREEQRIAQLAMYAYRCGNEADIVAALRAAWTEATEAAALKCEARRDARFAAFGTTEPDTGATYYGGRVEEEYNIRDEEDDDCAAAIRGGKL